MLIKNLRLSKRRPAFLDNAYNKYAQEFIAFSRIFDISMSLLLMANLFSQLTRCLGSGTLAFR